MGSGPVRLLLASLALGVATLALAAPTIQDYYKGFSFRYSLPAQHVGPERFIAPAETIGLAAFRLPDDGPQPPAALTLAALALVALLGLAGLALPTTDDRRTRMEDRGWSDGKSAILYPLILYPQFLRLRWLALLAAVLAYLIWLRTGRSYPYAYMKGSAYAGFVAWGAAALGAQALGRRLGLRLRPLVVALALAPLLVATWAQALTIGDHWRGPAIFTRDIAAFDSAAAQIPRGATVAVTSDGAFTGPISGQLVASLYGQTIWGHISTAYTSFDSWPAGGMPQYALLAANERPWPLDYGGQELWRSGTNALYRLDDAAQVLSGRSEFYSAAPPANRGSPATLAIWRRGGANRVASQAQPLTLTIGDSDRLWDRTGAGRARPASAAPNRRLACRAERGAELWRSAGDPGDRAQASARSTLGLATPATLTIAPEGSLALIDAERPR